MSKQAGAEHGQDELQLIAVVEKWTTAIDGYGFSQYLKTDTDTNFKGTDNRALIPVAIYFSDRYRYILLSPITDTDIKRIPIFS